MSCFCHMTTAALQAKLEAITAVPPPGTGANPLGSPAAQQAAALARELAGWMSQRALPAPNWQPEPAWQKLALPQVQLSAQTVATISALAQMRAQLLAQLGLDVLVPSQATAAARLVATLNARLDVLASANLSATASARWQALASLDGSIEQGRAALRAGLLQPTTEMQQQLLQPGGVPMEQWAPFVAQLQSLAPLIAASIQLNTSLAATAEFSAALRALSRVQLPALAQADLAASMSATLQATAQLSASLGVDVTATGVAPAERMVAEKLAQMMRDIAAETGIRTLGPEAAQAWPQLSARLPVCPVVPSGFAVPATVTAAMQAQAVAGLNWRATATPPAVGVALQAATLIQHFTVTMAASPVRATPCGQGCDAARLTRALSPG